MELSTLQFLWYLVVGLAMMMYTILDGFDLGVGALHLFARTDQERRIFLNTIGPVWDGNEVWLVVIVGGLLAGFPTVYASLLSSFYILVMLLIVALIFRAVAIEFRSKCEGKAWRSLWDLAFSFSSIAVSFLIGLALGNLIDGVPLNENFEFFGSFSIFFRPYPILVGILSIALFMMHGGVYLIMKTEGETREHVKKWLYPVISFFFVAYFITTAATFAGQPHMVWPLMENAWLFVFPTLSFIILFTIPYQVKKERDGLAFIFSSLAIIFFMILYGLGTYPILVRSTVDPRYSLTIFNSSASENTLSVLLIIVLIGVPLVLAYGYWVYRIFRGKVKLDSSSY